MSLVEGCHRGLFFRCFTVSCRPRRTGSPKGSPHYSTAGDLLCATPCHIFHPHGLTPCITGRAGGGFRGYARYKYRGAQARLQGGSCSGAKRRECFLVSCQPPDRGAGLTEFLILQGFTLQPHPPIRCCRQTVAVRRLLRVKVSVTEFREIYH